MAHLLSKINTRQLLALRVATQFVEVIKEVVTAAATEEVTRATWDKATLQVALAQSSTHRSSRLRFAVTSTNRVLALRETPASSLMDSTN